MANIAIFRINYKSDFILTLNSDAGWLTPFCIKFWTGAPSQAYFASYDGTTYTHCAPVAGEPTKLVVQFDDHHLPIGELKYQIGYHFTVADFPTTVEDEVLNQDRVVIELDGHSEKVMLDFNGETAPEIEFSLPAYANEQQRIANEEQRIVDEQQRIANEQQRIANEQQRIDQETARVNEFATLKSQSQAATRDANAAATLANEKAQLAADKAALADDAAQLAADKAALAQQKAEYAQQQGGYAKDQGDYAKNQGNYAKEQGEIAQADHERAEADHGIAVDDHTQAGNDHTRAESDHTRAESDHTRAESDHAAVEVYVDSLGAFDISAYHATGGVLAKYADLTAALGTNGANIPDALRKGGMSIKYVHTYDNKYARFNLLTDEFSTDVDDWQGVDDVPTAGSKNLVESAGTFDEINKYYHRNVDMNISWVTGKAYNVYTKTAINSSTNSYAIVPITNLTYINSTGKQGSSSQSPLLAFFDSNDDLISKFDIPSSSVTAKNVPVPSNAVKVIINIINVYTYAFYGVSLDTLQDKVEEYATPLIKPVKEEFLCDFDISDSLIIGSLYNVTTGVISSNANGAYVKGVLSETVYFFVVTGRQQASDNYPIITFFNSDGQIIKKVTSADTYFDNLLVDVPKDTEYFVINVVKTQDYQFVEKEVVSKDLVGLVPQLTNYELIPQVSLTENKLIRLSTGEEVNIGSTAAYATFNISGLTEIYVTGKQHGSVDFPIAIIYDNNNNIISSFGTANTLFDKQRILLPNNSAKLVMDIVSSVPYGCFKRGVNSEDGNIFYNISDENTINVSTKYNNTEDLYVRLRKKNINNFFDFTSFSIVPNKDKRPTDIRIAKSSWGSSTDYLSAMVVSSVNNKDGDAKYSHAFTGGAHAYSNNTGTPTMRCTNLKFYVDGRLATFGEKGYCRNIRITWTNYLQAYTTKKEDGTGREVLKQNYELFFDGVTWKVFCEIVALEDIVIEQYMGLDYQSFYDTGIYPKVRFIGDGNKVENLVENSPYSQGEKCLMIRGYGDKHEIIMTLDTNFDLGKREYMLWEGHAARSISTGKVYFDLIFGADNGYGNCALNAGEMASWKGTYQFIPVME